MASLSAGFNVGSSSTSSLIKSANTVANELATYDDTVARITWENSAKTYDDYTAYAKYLQGRITGLQSSGTVTNSTKAVDMGQTLTNAYHTYVSASINDASMQVMYGGAPLITKYNTIVGFAAQASANGDASLYNSLMTKAYSVSQQMQSQQQQSFTAATTLAKYNAAGEEDYANTLKSALQDLNSSIAKEGWGKFDSIVAQWMKSNNISQMLSALGIKLPSGAQPNYADIVAGVTKGMHDTYVLASQAVAPYDPVEANSYAAKAQGIADGSTTIPTIAGHLTASEINTMQDNPGAYLKTETGMQKAQLLSYSVDTKGNVVNNYNTSIAQVTVSAAQKKQLQNLGLTIGKTSGNTIEVQTTSKTPAWLQKVLGNSGSINTVRTDGTNIQFQTNDASGKTSTFNLATDSGGRYGIVQLTAGGAKALAGQYGFQGSDAVNSVISQSNMRTFNTNSKTMLQSVINYVNNSKSTGAPVSMPNVSPAALKSGAGLPTMTQRTGGGYNFSYNGKAISAATYSQMTGIQFRTLLQTMANSGDTGAGTALGFVGNDYKYDPTKVASYTNAGVYNALTWGSGVPTDTGAAPAKYLGNGAQLKF